MDDRIYGPLVSADEVEDAAEATLRTWAPEYLAWVERRKGLPPGSLPPPRSWVRSASVDRWPEEQLPSVLLVSTGLLDEPTKTGTGEYSGAFSLGLAVVVGGRTEDESVRRAKHYVAALRTLLVQRGALGGLASGVDWIDETYEPLPERPRRRSVAAGQAVFRIAVDGLASAKAGPLTPREDPLPPIADAPLPSDVAFALDPRSPSETPLHGA